jgi:hypothetical protein
MSLNLNVDQNAPLKKPTCTQYLLKPSSPLTFGLKLFSTHTFAALIRYNPNSIFGKIKEPNPERIFPVKGQN